MTPEAAAAVLPVLEMLQAEFDADIMTPRDAAVMRTAVAAERDRLRLALLACTVCGTIHEPHPAVGVKGEPYTSWAAPDGHPYQTRFRDGAARQAVADLLGAAP